MSQSSPVSSTLRFWVTVHKAEQAQAALRCFKQECDPYLRQGGHRVLLALLSQPSAGAQFGSDIFLHMTAEPEREGQTSGQRSERFLDCGGDAAAAYEALTCEGLEGVIFRGAAKARPALERLAAAQGKRLLLERPEAQDLLGAVDPWATLRVSLRLWLERKGLKEV